MLAHICLLGNKTITPIKNISLVVSNFVFQFNRFNSNEVAATASFAACFCMRVFLMFLCCILNAATFFQFCCQMFSKDGKGTIHFHPVSFRTNATILFCSHKNLHTMPEDLANNDAKKKLCNQMPCHPLMCPKEKRGDNAAGSPRAVCTACP